MILFQKDEAELENLDEGRLCLSFVNTSNWHLSSQPEESLHSYADLLAWARSIALISSREADHLSVCSKQDRAIAQKTLERAIELREAMFRLFTAMARKSAYYTSDLELINERMNDSLRHLRLLPSASGFARAWEADPLDLEMILWPVLRSAVELMASPELAYVKICADDRGCGWAFLDLSRHHNRRWCSMQSCGNRAKAQRHYARVSAN